MGTFRKILIGLIGVILLIYIVVIATSFPLKFGYTLSNAKEDWAYYATYVGELVTPVFALGAFIAAMYSYGVSRKQTAFNTIIKQIEFHYTILQGINIIIRPEYLERINIELPDDGRDYVSGKMAFQALYGILEQIYIERGEIKDYPKTPAGIEERIVDSFDSLYLEYGNQFGNYFKNLYLLIDYINIITANKSEKAYYIDLIKAQLSKFEILLLAYDCIWIQDKPPGKNFIDYARKNKLLSSLETNELIKDTIMSRHERLFNYRYGIFFGRPQLKIKTHFRIKRMNKYVVAGWLPKNNF